LAKFYAKFSKIEEEFENKCRIYQIISVILHFNENNGRSFEKLN